jgi:hypothetical protein
MTHEKSQFSDLLTPHLVDKGTGRTRVVEGGGGTQD